MLTFEVVKIITKTEIKIKAIYKDFFFKLIKLQKQHYF